VHLIATVVVLAFIENGLAFVVFGSVAFSLLMSFLFFATRGTESAWDRIGEGGISREDSHRGTQHAGESPAAQAERELEIRQMLSARSERLVRSGQPALDVDAELARLLADEPTRRAHDPELLAEVRQLVLARNERRVRAGEQPLDVEAEVARTLEELGG
jgi:hypothetical protein